jgi:hypothetical protein
MENALWLVLAVALGLFAYSFTAIVVNGFNAHLLYPIILGVINIVALWMLRK